MRNSETSIQQECADRVFYTVRETGLEHPLCLEGFTYDGVRIVMGEGSHPIYEGELSALLREFDYAILDRTGLALYID